MRPYLGVFPLVFSARKRAFSAPRICTVLAGHFARLVSDPSTKIICNMISTDKLVVVESIMASLSDPVSRLIMSRR